MFGFGGAVRKTGLRLPVQPHYTGLLTGVLMAVQETCGAQMQDYQHLLSSFKKAQTLYHWFEKEFGSWFCHEIIGFHLDEQEKIREWEAAGGRERCCRLAGETAAQVIRILQED